jgi:hypothetical protein
MSTRLLAGVQTCNFHGRLAPDRRLPFSDEVLGLELGAHQQFSAKAIDKCVILVLKQNALVALAGDSTALRLLVTRPPSSIVAESWPQLKIEKVHAPRRRGVEIDQPRCRY